VNEFSFLLRNFKKNICVSRSQLLNLSQTTDIENYKLLDKLHIGFNKAGTRKKYKNK